VEEGLIKNNAATFEAFIREIQTATNISLVFKWAIPVVFPVTSNK